MTIMKNLKMKDLPTGLRNLLMYWQGEVVKPAILEKICDEEISEDEEIKMFLEWCQTDYAQRDMSEEDKKDLQEILKTI